MRLAPQKRQLLSQQHDERDQILADLEQLDTDYSKNMEHIRRQTRDKVFRHEITRAHRHAEDKDIWEFLNDLIEVVHMYTWRKSMTKICTRKYQRKRQVIVEDLRDMEAQHRKERIKIRYRNPSEVKEQPQSLS